MRDVNTLPSLSANAAGRGASFVPTVEGALTVMSAVQPLNISLRSEHLEISNDDKSIEVNDEQFANKPYILLTCDVSNFVTST